LGWVRFSSSLLGEHILHRHLGGHGYARPPVVIGGTMTVRRWSFSSSGDTITHGRVFLISLPSVGSSRTRWTWPRPIGGRATATPTPRDRTPWTSIRRGVGRRSEPSCAWQLRPTRFEDGERLGRPTGPVAHEVRLLQPDSLHRTASSGSEFLANCRS
jgi:hypothetical protein